METPNLPAIRALRPAWNKGRIVGQKRPLKPKHVWAIKVRLELAENHRDLALFNMAMLALAKQDRQMRERLDILSSIPGIGITTALMILVDMPEIGGLGGKQIASLAGLAPMSQSSGKWQGKARIQGGRPNLRHAVFMPALVVIRHNADMKAKYDQLIAVGKEK
ncbi:IS110 family transposase [Yoonia sp.]|uniref:IS110 family transposase n=1 Tax=Yoonia sp. TaxID=2212373 RepID=UPI0025FE5A85|nr:IS110 family transposase [Yoonia sp.]